MALADFLARIADITGEGTRETDFRVQRGQRQRQYKQALADINLQKQRMKQFTATASPDTITGGYNGSSSGGDISGGGGGGQAPGKFQSPLHIALRVTSPYGVHRKGHKVAHTGVDWGAPSGTPIYAPASGKVRSTVFDKIYGNQTIMDFGGGYSSMFGHQSGFAVKPGQMVKAGQLIGYVGSTGNSTGPHLHFQTWVGNKVVNPLSWFG